jgi:hypothetical protein
MNNLLNIVLDIVYELVFIFVSLGSVMALTLYLV